MHTLALRFLLKIQTFYCRLNESLRLESGPSSRSQYLRPSWFTKDWFSHPVVRLPLLAVVRAASQVRANSAVKRACTATAGHNSGPTHSPRMPT